MSRPSLAIAEHAPLPLALLAGPTHRVRDVNAAFCRLMGRPAERLVGRALGELLPKRAGCLALIDWVSRTRKAQSLIEEEGDASKPAWRSYVGWPVLADEELLGVVLQVTETAENRGRMLEMNEALVVGALHQHELTDAAGKLNEQLRAEIAERRRVEEALHHAQAELADRAVQLEHLVAQRTAELIATNKQLEAFVYTIAHDLRAPLRAMQGFSELLVEEAAATLSEAGKNYAERINKAAQYMDALLGDLLAFSRLSQQRVELTAVNLEGVVRSVLSRLRKEIQDRNARVECSGPWPSVLAHEPTLAQVVFNLASNSLKFAAAEVPPRVRLRAEDRAEFVRVWVEDNGIGIAPDHQRQIFRLFTRLHGEKYPGTGIGLAIVQKGVERMGGRSGVESAAGQGARFWFELRKP